MKFFQRHNFFFFFINIKINFGFDYQILINRKNEKIRCSKKCYKIKCTADRLQKISNLREILNRIHIKHNSTDAENRKST